MTEVRVREVFGAVLLTAACVLATAGGIRGDPPPPTDTPVDTATVASTTTTAPADTSAEPPPDPAAATLAVSAAPEPGCTPVGAAGLLLPHQRPVVLAPGRVLSTARVAYPADGSVLTASGLSLEASCPDTRPVGGTAQVRGISLFGGAVTASSATLDLTGGAGTVSGLAVSGRPVRLVAGHPIRIGNWGYLIAPDPAAASRSAFEVELSSEHAGLPAGTLVFVPYAHIVIAPPPVTPTLTTPQTPTSTSASTTTTPTVRTPTLPAVTVPSPTRREPSPRRAPKRKHVPRHKPGRQPLTVTPPLEAGPYVFPVAGDVSYGDTYGALRTDVPGGWHHGDDIFAPLGSPVVAVANGTINRVGWERLGGWRLWVRDSAGDQFYYAHLSGYTPLALARGRVHRGDVIGFVGNTGDAFTTLAHLHFEVHPRSLLHLRYDGAVDPTSYLQSWPRPGKLHPPVPVHPRLPRASKSRHEAAINFRELLAARGIVRKASPELIVPHVLPQLREPLLPVAAAVAAPHRSSATAVWIAGAALGAAFAGLALMGGAIVVWRRRRSA